MCMRLFNSRELKNPVDVAIGCCVVLVAASGGAVMHAASLAMAVLFILSLFYINSWRVAWNSLERVEKLVCLGFILYTLTGFLSWINAADQVDFVKQAGRYLRFTLIIPIYLMIRYRAINLTPYFIVGVVLSGFVYFGFAIHDTQLQMVATGQYHRITYSNAIMLNVGILGLLLMAKSRRPIYTVIIGISFLFGFISVILSESRTSWMVLPVYVIIFMIFIIANKEASYKKLAIAILTIVALLPFTPAVDVVKDRYAAGVSDLHLFDKDENYNTSLGTRFSLWYIAYEVWKEHPIIGTGLGDFDEDMARYQEIGVYPGVILNNATHNIYFQALAGTGIVGLVVLCFSLVIAPLMLFYQTHNKHDIFRLIGYMLVLTYAIFGLSESWMLRSPVISIFLIYMVSIASTLKCNEADTAKR